MRATGTRAWSLTAAVIVLAAADSVADGARKIVQSVQETAKGIGKTLTEGATEVELRAKAAGAQSRPVGEKLEQSAQGFGESIWNGMKSVGRSLQKFFIGG